MLVLHKVMHILWFRQTRKLLVVSKMANTRRSDEAARGKNC